MDSAYRNNIEYSRSLQEKYEYYLVALTFTILALSVQTAKFTDDKVTTSLLLLGWGLLIISGFIALLRLEMQPLGHENFAILDEKKEILAALKEGGVVAQNGSEQLIEKLQSWVDKNEPILNKFESKIILQYQIHKYLFFAGVLSVILSRAYRPFLGLFESQC
ncbi:MAG: hypothetical protein RPT94_05175 [Candidatus Sedimenticola sp. (ex Thyasira tokunagai)]